VNYFIGEKLTFEMAAGGACIVAGNLLALAGPLQSATNDEAETPEERAALADELPGDAALPLSVELEGGETHARS
jgi:hypothetical protein